jgi:hypothetical protein
MNADSQTRAASAKEMQECPRCGCGRPRTVATKAECALGEKGDGVTSTAQAHEKTALPAMLEEEEMEHGIECPFDEHIWQPCF